MAKTSKSSATSTTTPTTKKSGFLKRTFSKVTDKALDLAGNAVKTAAKTAVVGGAVWAGERLIENAYEGYTGKDIKWTIDGSTFGVAVVDPDRYLETNDRSQAGKNTVAMSAGIHTNVMDLEPNQNIIGVSVDGNVYGVSKEDIGSTAAGVTDTLKDAFSSENVQTPQLENVDNSVSDVSDANDISSVRESADSFIDYGTENDLEGFGLNE